MPNWCQNVATIVHEDKELIDNIENELKKEKDDVALFQMLRPRPETEEENWYSWNIDHWGTKWEASIYDFERIDDYTIKINFDTAWGPCIAFYEFLETEGYTVEGFYNEEGMAFCGCYRDGYDDSYNYSDYYSASGIRDNVPSDIDDIFGLSERMEDNEEESEDLFEEDEEDIPKLPEYEMTDWFDKKTKPFREGVYEVKTKSWPFPHKAEWRKKKWYTLDVDNQEYAIHSDVVTEWRGIAYDPVQKEADLMKALEELKEEFDKLMVEEQ